MLWEASPEDTTATLSIGVPLDTEAAVAAGNAAEALTEGARPLFFGATMTLLEEDRRNHTSETLTQFQSETHSCFILNHNPAAAGCNYSTNSNTFGFLLT